jgi:hypothetical protein
MLNRHLDEETLARLAEGDREGLGGDDWRHLAGCPACRATFLATAEILHHWHAQPGAMPVPPDLLVAGHRVARKAAAGAAPIRRRRWRWQLLGAPLGGLAMAASLVAALLLPPRPTGPAVATRGVTSPDFQRPVEGEMVPASRSLLVWTPVPQATRYLIQLRDSEGTSLWEASTTDTCLRLPEALRLEPGIGYRALLSVQPADLLPPGSLSVGFRSGGAWARAWDHARRPQPSVQLLASGGLLLLSVSLLRRRPRPAAAAAGDEGAPGEG